jgi:hypothetical protein
MMLSRAESREGGRTTFREDQCAAYVINFSLLFGPFRDRPFIFDIFIAFSCIRIIT